MTLSMCAIGDNVLDRYPQEGLAFPGGSATNAAVFASRLGVSAAYIGIVGSDASAAFIEECLASEGVDAGRVKRQDAPNPSTDVVVDPDGNRRFTAHTPPEMTLRLSDDDLAFLDGVDWIHTGHSSYVEHELDRMARAAPISFDFSKRDLDYAAPLLPSVAVATFSRDELTIDESVELLHAAVALGARQALVTRGAAGAVALSDGRVLEQPAQAATVIDTIGAGDAFQTCLMTELARGRSLEDALAAASAFAAATCGYRGSFGHQRSLADFETTMEEAVVDMQ
ncbi:PfkB family carbohydrate kinase [Microbacterium sp. 179-I 3D3 NHS]|uniref:PfkB family carbohydrate kinase n=1 Tax=unclassified Microbacterium TaxID=2609290 RepID=UPI0039A2633C